MALTCKNCGGSITFDKEKFVYICDFCGRQQSVDDGDIVLCDGEQVAAEAIQKYNHALRTMNTAVSENMFTMAAILFDEVNGFSDSVERARECRFRAAELRCERLYASALEDMNSPDPEKINKARGILISLGDYEQAKENADKCLELYQIAVKKQPKPTVVKLEKEKEKEEGKGCFTLLLIILLIIVAVIIGNKLWKKAVYSSDNIVVEFVPQENSYLTEYSNRYVFNYLVTLENNGKKDIDAIEGTVAFVNKENNVVVDTKVSFSGNPIVVRHGKTSKYSWELTVYSETTARELYYTDFEDFEVELDITSIRFSNGKTIKYE